MSTETDQQLDLDQLEAASKIHNGCVYNQRVAYCGYVEAKDVGNTLRDSDSNLCQTCDKIHQEIITMKRLCHFCKNPLHG